MPGRAAAAEEAPAGADVTAAEFADEIHRSRGYFIGADVRARVLVGAHVLREPAFPDVVGRPGR